MRCGTPKRRALKLKLSTYPAGYVWWYATTAVVSIRRWFGQGGGMGTGGWPACASGPRTLGPDSKSGAVRRREQRWNCLSPTAFTFQHQSSHAHSGGWPASTQERRERVIRRQARELNERPSPNPSPQRG